MGTFYQETGRAFVTSFDETASYAANRMAQQPTLALYVKCTQPGLLELSRQLGPKCQATLRL